MIRFPSAAQIFAKSSSGNAKLDERQQDHLSHVHPQEFHGCIRTALVVVTAGTTASPLAAPGWLAGGMAENR
jgi:hypothetical protein